MADKKTHGQKPKVPPIPIPAEDPNAFFDHQTGAFFRKVDWSAFWTTFIISFGVYVFTMAPTVTLEDSGELAIGPNYLGVPHPPGYPIWDVLTFFIQWMFHWVRYYGQPNPAWGVTFASTLYGGLAAGGLALLISRSGTDILRNMKKTTEVIGYSTETLLSWASAVMGGLVFAFSPVLWSQAVIVEVYSLNALFMVIIMILTYVWMCRPKEDNVLYLTSFLFGLGLTNHQALLFIGPGLAMAVWYRDRALFRDCLAGLFVCVAGYLFWQASGMKPDSEAAIHTKQMNILLGLIFLVAPVALLIIYRKLMTEWKRVLILLALAGLGFGFNAYLPFSSEQNPPINWGYPRTTEGFKHALTRGQYEKIDPVANFKDCLKNPGHLMSLCKEIIVNPRGYTSVVAQFDWLSLLVIVFFLFFFKMDRRSRHWVMTTFITFFTLTVVFIVFQYPQLDVQTLFIGRVQYIQAHGFFALWIGYGAILGLAWLDSVLRNRRLVKYAGTVAVLLLPLQPILDNAYNSQLIKICGGTEENGHDFGWQFGDYELRGADAIMAQLKPGETPPPDPKYPPQMETNAIFYGGTDPGRFVPTYMLYCAKVRTDVYLITQNALADNTYMNVMRDLYGDTIWIPSQQDSNYAFQKYVEDVQAGRIPAGADVSFENGRVSVQGVQGVMMINGILAKMIFEANKHKHAFYVEESYVIPWMYPYLEPHGLIMKINAETIPSITPQMVKNDKDFWDWYSQRLLNNWKFRRDVVARKTFSKLRGAIAGIYTFRHMYNEAEHAFRQAIDLYPLSPEANFRLADVFMQQRRFTDARVLIEKFLNEDPENDKVRDFLNQIKDTEKADLRRSELEGVFSKGQGELNAALELADLYSRLGLQPQFQGLAMNILNDTNLPPSVYMAIAKICMDAKRMDMLGLALQKYLMRDPGNVRIWIDFAAVNTALQRNNEAVMAVKRAIDLGGDPVRDAIRKDPRFNSIRDVAEFKALVPPIQAAAPMSLPQNLPMF